MQGNGVMWQASLDASEVMAALDEIMTGLDAVDQSMSSLGASGAQLSGMDDVLTSLQNVVTELSVGFDNLDNSLQQVIANTDATTTAVNDLEGSIAGVSASIDALGASAGTAGAQVGALGPEADAAVGPLEALQGAMGPLMMIGTVAAMVGGKLVSMGMDGQKGEALLRGMAGASQADINALETDAEKLGVGMDQATAGFYRIESAGYDAAHGGIQVFDASMRLAKGGQADASDVMTGLTAIMHDYGQGANQASNDTDLMAQAVFEGNQSMQDFAQSVGPLAAAAHNAGFSLKEVLAAEAAMTLVNPHVRQDTQQLTGLMQSLSPAMGKTAATAKTLGLSFDEAHFKSLDLLGKLEYLAQISGGTGTAAFVKLTGGVRGSTAAVDLMMGKAGKFKQDLEGMNQAAGRAGNSFNQWENTIPGALDHVGASLSIFSTKLLDAIGPKVGPLIAQVSTGISNMADLILNHTNEVMPVLTGLAGVVGGALVLAIAAFIASAWPVLAVLAGIGLAVAGVTFVIQHWGQITTSVGTFFQSTWTTVSSTFKGALSGIGSALTQAGNTVSSVGAGIVNWFHQWEGVIKGVAIVLGVFFGPALIKAGVEAVVSGAKIAGQFVGSLIKTGIEAAVSGVKLSISFVQTMIKAGVEAVVSGAKIAASFVASMVRAGIEAVINGAKITASFVASLIKTGIEGWQSAGKLATFIGSMIASGTQAVLAGAKIAASFVASMVKAGVEAAAAGAKIAAQFIATLIKTGIQAAITGAQMLASLVPAIASVVAEAVVAAATAIPGLVIGFIAWAGAAWTAAAGTIAATWPVLLIIVAIAALIAIIVLLATHWKQVTQAVGNAMSALGTKVHQILEGIGQKFSELGTKANQMKNTIGQKFSELGTNVHNSVTTLGTNVLAQWNKLNGSSDKSWSDIAHTAATRAGQLKDMVLTSIRQMVTNFGLLIIRMVSSFRPFFEMLSHVPGPVGDMAKGVLKQMDTLKNGVSDKTAQMKVLALQHTADMHNEAVAQLEQMRQKIIQQIQDTKDPVTKKMLEMKEQSVQHMENMHHDAANQALQMKSEIVQHTQDMSNQVVGHSIIPDMVNGVVSWFQQLPGRAGAALQSMVSTGIGILNGMIGQAMTAGSNIVNGIANGIRGAIGAVGSAIGAVTSFISDHLPHSPAKVGPLRDLPQAAANISKQIAEGMLTEIPTIQASMTHLLQPVITMPKVPVGAATGFGGGGSAQTNAQLQQIIALLQQQQQVQNTISHTNMNNTINAPGISDVQKLYRLLQSLGGYGYESVQRGSYGIG